MVRELLIALLLLALAVLPAVLPAVLRRPQGAWVWLALGWGLAPLVFLALAFQFRQGQSEAPADMPVVNRPSGYVGSGSCLACHPHQHATWSASYHRTMTQLATPETVTGNFDHVPLQLDGKRYVLKRDGERFLVEMEHPLVKQGTRPLRVHFPLTMTTGSHHMQLYWYPIGQSRIMGLLPFIYLHEEQRWIPRRAAFLFPPGSEQEAPFGRWNETCSRCHTTRPQHRIGRGELVEMDTQVAEFGIGCEECHGPGGTHVARHRNPLERYRRHLAGGADDTIVNPARLPPRQSAQVCGQCHGIYRFQAPEDEVDWLEAGYPFEPGQDLESQVTVLSFDNLAEASDIDGYDPHTQFWSDGMCRVSGREYNGLARTPCFQRGEMSCLSCHAMHPASSEGPLRQWADDQLGEAMETDQACLQCHREFSTPAAAQAHTHHAASSPGSRCYNCHMPHTTYGLLKAIRSHQVDSPSVEASLATGRPNACNQCHLDQTLQWTAERLREWYGIETAAAIPEEHRTTAAAVVWALRGDAAQRALIAWSMGWAPAHQAAGSRWLAPHLGQLLEDPYDAVRFIAARSLRNLPGMGDLEYDFLASPDERAEQHRRALERFRDSADAAGESAGNVEDRARERRARTLVTPSGVLQERFRELLRQRDDRPIQLLE